MKIQEHMMARSCRLSLETVHPDTVDKIISGLSNSSAFGLDNIDTYIVKLIKSEILPAITHMINLPISSHKFPSAWKKKQGSVTS